MAKFVINEFEDINLILHVLSLLNPDQDCGETGAYSGNTAHKVGVRPEWAASRSHCMKYNR